MSTQNIPAPTSQHKNDQTGICGGAAAERRRKTSAQPQNLSNSDTISLLSKSEPQNSLQISSPTSKCAILRQSGGVEAAGTLAGADKPVQPSTQRHHEQSQTKTQQEAQLPYTGTPWEERSVQSYADDDDEEDEDDFASWQENHAINNLILDFQDLKLHGGRSHATFGGKDLQIYTKYDEDLEEAIRCLENFRFADQETLVPALVEEENVSGGGNDGEEEENMDGEWLEMTVDITEDYSVPEVVEIHLDSTEEDEEDIVEEIIRDYLEIDEEETGGDIEVEVENNARHLSSGIVEIDMGEGFEVDENMEMAQTVDLGDGRYALVYQNPGQANIEEARNVLVEGAEVYLRVISLAVFWHVYNNWRARYYEPTLVEIDLDGGWIEDENVEVIVPRM